MKQVLKKLIGILLGVFPTPNHPTHRHPGLHVRWRIGWIRGILFRYRASLAQHFGGPRISIGKHFSLQGRLRAKGPGEIIIGSEVVVASNTDLYTHSAAARITIGDEVFLNGTRMGCEKSIAVGPQSIISDVRIMDSDFHSISKRRNERGAEVLVESVVIGANVWLAAGVAVLKGVVIGDNSVVAFGSVVNKSLPNDCVAAGNPCKPIGVVPE